MYKRLSIRRLCLIIGLMIATAIAVSLGASFRAEADGSSSLGISSVAYYPFSSDTDGTFRIELGQDDVTTIVQDKTYESYPNSSGDAMESATYYRPAIIVSGDRSSFSDVSTTSLTARKTKYGEDYIIIGNTSDKTEQTDFRYSCPFTFQEIADGNWARAFGNKLAMSFGVVKPFKTNLWESTYEKTYYFQAAIICIKAERYTYYPHKAGKVTYSISKLGTLDCFAYNYKKDCEQRLKECNENSGDSIVNSYYRVLGITDVKDNMPITVKYKTMKDYGEYVEKTATFTVPKSIFLNSAKVEEYMYAARIKKKTVAQTDYYFENLADFNVNFIESEFARVTGDKYYPLEQRFEFSPTKVAAQQDGIITVHYALTDSWHVVINYLETLGTLQESAPFARRRTYDGLLSVSKVADIKSITEKQIAELLGRQNGNMNVLASRVEKVDVAFDNKATFTINLKYTFVSLKTMDDSGRAKEVQVPLTTYKQWVDNMGTNWSILMLNREDRQYFKYSDEVAPSDLYGYFTCAVFEEKVSDLNYIFAKTSGAGTITVFSDTQAKVTSSYLYKKLSNVFNDTNNVFIKVATYPLLSFCELLNDDNSQVFSYYMYVDNTTDMPWFGRNGATSREDEDPAAKNWFEDKVSGLTGNKKVQYVFWVVIGTIMYLLLTGIASKAGLLSSKSWFTWIWLGITVILLIVAFIYGYVIIIKG